MGSGSAADDPCAIGYWCAGPLTVFLMLVVPALLIVEYPPIGVYIGVTIYGLYACCCLCKVLHPEDNDCQQGTTGLLVGLVLVALVLGGPAWLIVVKPPIGVYIGVTIYGLYACGCLCMLVDLQHVAYACRCTRSNDACRDVEPGNACLMIVAAPFLILACPFRCAYRLCCSIDSLAAVEEFFSSDPAEKDREIMVFYVPREKGNGDSTMLADRDAWGLLSQFETGFETFTLHFNDGNTARRRARAWHKSARSGLF